MSVMDLLSDLLGLSSDLMGSASDSSDSWYYMHEYGLKDLLIFFKDYFIKCLGGWEFNPLD